MNTEQRILAAATRSRAAWSAITQHIPESDLSEPGRLVLGAVTQYYERDLDAQSVDTDTLRGLVLQSVPNPKHRETFSQIIDRLSGLDVSAVNIAAELLGAKREALAARLSSDLASGKAVPELAEQYIELCKATELDEGEVHETLNNVSVADLLGSTESGDLIPMYPKSLNDRLDGGLIKGHHVLVFARPEMGKTLFLVNLIRGFLRHGFRVLYLGNEEPVTLTLLRVKQRLAEMNKYEVVADPAEADRRSANAGFDRLFARQMTPGTPREIEELCEEVKPDVLIVDQIRHLNVKVKDGNYVRQLEQAANHVRQIASRQRCLAISVTQAGDSATGKPVLDMEDVDFSNTGVQGAVDVMIGIGASREDEQSGRRVLSLPKNKRTGRHDFFAVEVDIPLNRVISLE